MAATWQGPKETQSDEQDQRDQSEFTTDGDQGELYRMDLLTVLMHEMGHVFGHEHTEEGLMSDVLATGVRKTLEDL